MPEMDSPAFPSKARVPAAGLEPATHGLEGRRSIQLSYAGVTCGRVPGPTIRPKGFISAATPNRSVPAAQHRPTDATARRRKRTARSECAGRTSWRPLGGAWSLRRPSRPSQDESGETPHADAARYRGARIRTGDLVLPGHARYQAAPRPAHRDQILGPIPVGRATGVFQDQIGRRTRVAIQRRLWGTSRRAIQAQPESLHQGSTPRRVCAIDPRLQPSAQKRVGDAYRQYPVGGAPAATRQPAAVGPALKP